MGIRSVSVSLLASASVSAALLLAGCATAQSPVAGGEHTNATGSAQQGAAAQIAALGFDVADPQALVDGLDTLPVADRPSPDALVVSVRSDALVLQPGDVTVPMAGDRFYLSIAPYVNETHPCTFHSLTTCLGELQNEPIDLTVTDAATGETVVSEATQTFDNGFVGVWLPKNGSFDVTVTGAAGTATERVGTGAQDPTCLTTMQLKA